MVTNSKIIGVGVLCGSALALPEHTLVSGRLQGGRQPTRGTWPRWLTPMHMAGCTKIEVRF